MKMKLTKREKVLLYTLMIIVIVAVGVFFFTLPVISSRDTLSQEKEVAQMQLATLKAQEVKETNLAEKLEAAKTELANQKARFYADFHAEDVDALLTSMVYQYGMTPISMSISEVKEEELYTYEETLQMRNKEEASNEIEPKKVQVCNVSMQISGEISQAQALVDAANANTSLRVSGVNYEVEAMDKTISVTFKLYLI